MIGRQTDFDVATQESEKNADAVMAAGRLADLARATAKTTGGDAHPVAFLEDGRERRRDRQGRVLAQMGDRVIAQSRRSTAKRHQTQYTAGAYDMADLLGIVKMRKEIAGEKRLCGGMNSARAALPADPDPGGKGLDLIALGEIERGDVFAPALGPQAEPAEATGIQ